MIVVEDILDEVAEVLGLGGTDPRAKQVIYRRLNRAVEMLSAKGDWDPLLDTIDVCAQGSCVALPPFVYTVLGVSTEGVPYIGRDRFFEFHLNGPGYVEPGQSGRDWREQGYFATQYEIGTIPGRLIAVSDDPDDAGATLRVFGLDSSGLRLSTPAESSFTSDGIEIPINAGYSAASLTLPEVLLIDRVRKPVTKGRVRLYVDRGSGEDSELLGRYEFDETNPRFLRITLGREADSVRVFFRHKTAKITGDQDVIRLHNTMALLNAVKSIRYYLGDDPEQGAAYEAVATRMLQEQESVRQPPNASPITVVGVAPEEAID